MRKRIIFLLVVLFACSRIFSQDFGFGFGFEEEETESGGGSFFSGSAVVPPVSISGEVSAAVIGYLEDIKEGADNVNTLEMFMLSGRLNFFAQSSFAEGVINLKFVPALVPVNIDEAYISAFFGGLDVSAGLKKVSWGKADQFGPLDILNLPDQSRIFIEMADNNNLMGVKIANPIIHASYRFGRFSKLEGVFLPSFEVVSTAMSTAITGDSNPIAALFIGSSAARWMPEQMNKLSSDLNENNGSLILPEDISSLSYSQAGLRFTTTIGSADIGLQYFYGRMLQPAVRYDYNFDDPDNPKVNSIELIFNKYHQIGLDYAQVLAGFNIRAEAAANITDDLKGDDGYIYNPSIGWSFGFDRDIFGFNINLQANGSVRLFDDKTGSSDTLSDNFDNEGGSSMTATRLTAMLSRKFMRDELELRAAVVWGIEDMDFAVIPAVIWMRDDLRAALSGSFFFGDSDGMLGSYKKNNFLKISVVYTF